MKITTDQRWHTLPDRFSFAPFLFNSSPRLNSYLPVKLCGEHLARAAIASKREINRMRVNERAGKCEMFKDTSSAKRRTFLS